MRLSTCLCTVGLLAILAGCSKSETPPTRSPNANRSASSNRTADTRQRERDQQARPASDRYARGERATYAESLARRGDSASTVEYEARRPRRDIETLAWEAEQIIAKARRGSYSTSAEKAEWLSEIADKAAAIAEEAAQMAEEAKDHAVDEPEDVGEFFEKQFRKDQRAASRDSEEEEAEWRR